jgi:hypothetical protein
MTRKRLIADIDGPLAQWQSGGLLIRVRPGFDPLTAHSRRRWCNGQHGGLLNRRRQFDPGAAYASSVGVTAISPGPQPGDCGFKPRTEHSRPYGLWVRIAALQAAGWSSNLRGVTAGTPAAIPVSPNGQGPWLLTT